MGVKKMRLLVLIALPIWAAGQNLGEDEFRLFFLGGQSNMDGYGMNADLPESLTQSFENVWIFHGNSVAEDQENGGLSIDRRKVIHSSKLCYYGAPAHAS